MSIPMNVEQRTIGTKGALRQLRESGKVPGVVYGKQLAAPAAVALEEKQVLALLRSHPNAVLDLDIPGAGKQPVMISEVQREPLSRRLLHIDMRQINMNEEVRTQVRIDFVGEANGVGQGGILQVLLHELEVECLPGSIPEALEINVADLELGHSLLVRDVRPPSGVKVLSDPEQVVVTVLAPQKELTEEEAEAAEVERVEAESRSEEAQMHEVDFA
ncbi:50S ribosomal protein L25 [Paenibacillus radicis (ex Gao et al. 2016)]|uniref:Large ribosomal subunit protein bL25 n=1 Tax=Paenibacillus radicis (ex Gao et al. 2016) TaxID=1737354 RepID=A0A917MA90_9BACL|nr:50S ribosomal protein L25 [Paenibacillus radicis (ex Gao et al. 2016)]GGG87483.1 50S ribosomal protein L25 [Paenibacillus radicis (ex Gao et al. 2016)]